MYNDKIEDMVAKKKVRLVLSIFLTEEILHMYINRTIMPPRYRIIIVYISQFKFILIKLTLTITDPRTKTKQDINKDLEKNRKIAEAKKIVFHNNISFN